MTVHDASQLTGGDGVDASLLGITEHPAAGSQVASDRPARLANRGDVIPAEMRVRPPLRAGGWPRMIPSCVPL
ncbi:MAG: hypothetical protein ABW219_04130, partial [Ilumatobacteraceae bacterium]